MHIDRLGLVSHFYKTLLNCLSMCQGSYIGTIMPCREVRQRCTAAVSAGCCAHQFPGCEYTRNRSCAPLKSQNGPYMGMYGHIQPYIQAFTYIYKLKIYICIMFHLLACLSILKCFYIRRNICIKMYFGLYLVSSYIIKGAFPVKDTTVLFNSNLQKLRYLTHTHSVLVDKIKLLNNCSILQQQCLVWPSVCG